MTNINNSKPKKSQPLNIDETYSCLRWGRSRRLEYRETRTSIEAEDRIEQEIRQAIEITHDSRNGKTKSEKKKLVESIRSDIRERYWGCQYDSGRMREILKLSLKILGVLKTKGLCPRPNPEIHQQALMDFKDHATECVFPEFDSSSYIFLGERKASDVLIPPAVIGPNTYFDLTQPNLVLEYGYPFFTSLSAPSDSVESGCSRECFRGINVNFFAAYLGGDRRLQHDVIFYLPEKRFLFFDPFSKWYVPTTEEKLCFNLSLTIQRLCCGLEVNEANLIISQFQSKTVLNDILDKAKALLATERGFFEGDGAPVRFVAEVAHPGAIEGTVGQFVDQEIQKDEKEILTLTECLAGFKTFSNEVGGSLSDPREIKINLQQVIRQVYEKGMRNDIQVEGDRSTRGWKGLRLRDRVPDKLRENKAVLADTCPDKSALSAASPEQAETERQELLESLCGG